MIRHSKDGYCISLPFVVKCSCKPPEKTTTLLPPVITTDNNLITAHRIGWIIWTHQIIKKMRYQIYEAKSVKHDAQQRVGIKIALQTVSLKNRKIQQLKPLPMQQKTFAVFSHRKRFFYLLTWSITQFIASLCPYSPCAKILKAILHGCK